IRIRRPPRGPQACLSSGARAPAIARRNALPPTALSSMHAPDQTLSVLSFFGVVIQLGGALMVIGLFLMLRHFVLRRRYFGAWATAWIAFAAAIAALVVRYMIVPGVLGADIAESNRGVRVAVVAPCSQRPERDGDLAERRCGSGARDPRLSAALAPAAAPDGW